MNGQWADFSKILLSFLVGPLPVVFIIGILLQNLMKKYLEDRKKVRYDDDKLEATLSEIRASYEKQIAKLAREMIATKPRWEDANHLLISGQQHQSVQIKTGAVNVDNFLGPYGIDHNKIIVDPDLIFVLTPFSKSERAVFGAIKSICSEVGFTVVRGDETRAEGDILQQIIEGIVVARIVIANISSRNPNVFFELGIAMALGKSTILVSDTLSDTPFDVRGRRIVVYNNDEDLRDKLKTSLLQVVR